MIVTGCLGAKPEKITERHPAVLKVTGPHAYEEVVGAVHEHLPPKHDPFMDLVPPQGVRLTPRHYAYLKISEGCNHRCRFCIIPSMRGDLASRPIDQVLNEAIRLRNAGVRELLVISQDTSAYGADLKYRAEKWGSREIPSRFIDLARELGEIGPWVRLHYVYPYPHVDDVIPLMAEGKVLPYLDVPFQHGSPRILKLMRRPATRSTRWRASGAGAQQLPQHDLRSTFIVGFPGETEDDFRILLDWLEEAELDRVGCFRYSPVEGAAANALPDPVPDAVKEERWHRFMQAQQKISARRLAARVGRRMRVLVDAIEDGAAIARSEADAPEIDGVVRVKGKGAGKAAARRVRRRRHHRRVRVRPRSKARVNDRRAVAARDPRRHHDARRGCDRECRERDAARRRRRGRRDPSRGRAGAARRVPPARRLRDGRREDHVRLPAAGAARDPHRGPGLARRRQQRAGAAGLLLPALARDRGGERARDDRVSRRSAPASTAIR